MFLEQPGKAIPGTETVTITIDVTLPKVSDDTEVIRYLVQLNDWNWGHYVLIGNISIHQYRIG